MFKPISFTSKNGLSTSRLKLDIDRRINKIAWLCQRKLNQTTMIRPRALTFSTTQAQTEQIYQFNHHKLCHDQPLILKTQRYTKNQHIQQNYDFGLSTTRKEMNNTRTQISINCEQSTSIISGHFLSQSNVIDLKHYDNPDKQIINEQYTIQSLLSKKCEQSQVEAFQTKQTINKEFLQSLKRKKSQQSPKKSPKDKENKNRKEITDIQKNEQLFQTMNSIVNSSNSINDIKNTFQYPPSFAEQQKFNIEGQKSSDYTGFFRKRNITSYQKINKNQQKFNISIDTKVKMAKNVSDILMKERNQTPNYKARSNLLKRIQSRYTHTTVK